MAMKKEHPDYYLRFAQLTRSLNEALCKTHRYSPFAEMGEYNRLELIIEDIENSLKAASNALAIIKNGK